ncbi:hypothetical protein MWN34_04440 [Ancylobacter sp. 6x-1]|uniref:Transporter n=1 Tax=Ancylobacter crimeensis TaxID=2579147 RepID=A0ABT0D867_9HYPH|nr:DUF6662 family protein [Ancylobacter crimeensis]MCK0196155.1 hypothetical protein [Ancylobacter crimeensis]
MNLRSQRRAARPLIRAFASGSFALLATGACLATLPAAPAHAADLKAQAAPTADTAPAGYEIDSENIFGFTEGSDTNDRGEQEVTITGTGRFKRATGDDDDRSSHYSAWEAEAEYEYGVTRNLTLGVSASFAHHDISNIEDMDDVNGGGFNGLGASLKYRFLSWEHDPVGLAISVEPEWSRYGDDDGERVDGFSLPIKVMLDKELVSETLFGALNLAYEPEWAGSEKESSLEASAALSWQVTNGIFIGGEARYLAGFNGAALDDFEGGAFYLGPSFYAQLSKAAHIKVAYSYQVAGSSPESEGNLDLVNHERQQLLLQFGVEF